MGGSNFGKFVLRLTVGGLMLFHGIHKITDGIDGVKGALVGKDLPEWIAYGVYVGEILAPLLIVIGLKTRLAALILCGNMVMAIYLVHMDDLTTLVRGAPAVELQLFYLLGAFSIMLIGPGGMSIDEKRGKSAGGS